VENSPLQGWHDYASSYLLNQQSAPESSGELLNALLADDVVFHSPVVHSPQHGKAICHQYLSAATAVFSQGPFEYVNEWHSSSSATLEFRAELDGIVINGVDIIHWNDNGQITEFKVMVRPLKAVNTLHAMMKAMLESSNTVG